MTLDTSDLNFKLKLSSKKLYSGKYQVKFQVSDGDADKMHGYVLTEPKTSLREVVERIFTQVNKMQEKDLYYHGHLYSMGASRRNENDFFIFDDSINHERKAG